VKIPNATICENDLPNVNDFPLNPEFMIIPRLRDKLNPKVAHEVDRLTVFSRFLSEDCFKASHSYRLFTKNEENFRDLKDNYVDIVFEEYPSSFPHELALHHKLNLYRRSGHQNGVIGVKK